VRRLLAAGVLLFAGAAPVLAQTAAPRVTVGGRMQYQWSSTSVSEEDAAPGVPIAPSTFEHRRVRLWADVQVSDWIRGRVEPEFALGQLRLRNAWMALALTDQVTVRAGQFKKPFSAIFGTSSGEVPLIERGVRIRGLEAALRSAAPDATPSVRGEVLVGENEVLLEAQRYATYDMGLALEGRLGDFGWAAGVFNGQGSDARDENGALSGSARVTWRTDPGLPVTLGAGWSRRAMNWPAPLSLERRSGDAFVADVQLGGFRRGLWLLAEASTGDNLATEERFAGGQAMLAWFNAVPGRRIEGWEPVARVSYGDPDRTVSGDEGVLLTPGINIYFPGRNRLMLNWDVYMPRGEGLRTQHAARAQINLEF
jgi:hypothetical protein